MRKPHVGARTHLPIAREEHEPGDPPSMGMEVQEAEVRLTKKSHLNPGETVKGVRCFPWTTRLLKLGVSWWFRYSPRSLTHTHLGITYRK